MASGSSLYPRVRNSNALCTRLGVFCRPSRSGSSPRRTRISFIRSSNDAEVTVGISIACFISALASSHSEWLQPRGISISQQNYGFLGHEGPRNDNTNRHRTQTNCAPSLPPSLLPHEPG